MKKLLFVLAFMIAAIGATCTASALVYNENNPYFITDGKLNANYAGFCESCKHMPWPPECLFTFYNGTNNIKMLDYYEPYPHVRTIYNYNSNGTLRSIYRYDNGYLTERRNYSYEYYSRSNIIKKATQTIYQYNYISSKVFKEEENIKYLSKNGTVEEDEITINEYDPITGKRTKHEVIITTYYQSGNVKSKVLQNPDNSGNIKYEYYDENFYGNNIGRVQKVTKKDNSYEIFTEYWQADGKGTDKVKIKNEYDKSGKLVATYRYYSSGNLELKTLSKPDKNGNVQYYYYDENWYGNGTGRVEWIGKADTSRWAFNYKFGTDKVDFTNISAPLDGREPSLKKVTLKKGKELELYSYSAIYVYQYESGNIDGVLSWLKPSSAGQDMLHWYKPLDEAYYQTILGPMGRIYEEALVPLNTSLPYEKPYRYVYSYWGLTDTLRSKKIYTEGQHLGCADKLTDKIDYNTRGNEVRRTTYEYSSTYPDQMISKSLTAADEAGNIKYEYKDEAFYSVLQDEGGVAHGRLFKVTKQGGSYEIYAEYWEGTDKVKVKKTYDRLGHLINTQRYDSNGNLIGNQKSMESNELSDKAAVEQKAMAQFSDKKQYNIQGEMASKVNNQVSTLKSK